MIVNLIYDIQACHHSKARNKQKQKQKQKTKSTK